MVLKGSFMPPPTIMVVKNKSTPIQVRKLLLGTTLDPTQDGDNITADTSTEGITTGDNPNNPMIEAFGRRYLWHRSHILERDIGGEGAWGISLTIALGGGSDGVFNGRYHSGLHVIYPAGVETLVGMFVRDVSSTQVHYYKTTDGINWTTNQVATLAGTATAFGRSIVFGSSVYWLVYGSGTALIVRDFNLDTTITWDQTDLDGPTVWISSSGATADFAIHKDKLFLAAARTNQNSFDSVLFRLDGSVWTTAITLDAGTDGGGTVDRCVLFSDGDDLIFFYNDSVPTCIRVQNPLTGSISVSDITGTVLSGVGGGISGQWQKYLDVTTPGTPVWYLWYNQGGQNVGTYDCYQYTNISTALTLLGSGISAVDFTLPSIGDGGSDRIPAKTEGRPQFDGLPSEVIGGRKRLFRVFGVGSDLTLSQYHSADQEAPETLSTLVNASITIEDATDATGLVGNLGELALEALSPTSGDSYVVSDIDGDASLTPGAVAISEGDTVTFDGANWAVQVSGNLPFFTDLEAYYKLEGTGSRVDSSGNNLTLTETGTVPTGTGIFGNGADFPGTSGNHLARAGDDATLDLGVSLAPFGVSAWVDADTLSTGIGYSEIVGKSNNTSDGWELAVLDTGGVSWRQAGSGLVDSGAAVITVGAGLQHIVATSDGIITRIYVDNVEVATGSSVAVVDSTTAFRVGHRSLDVNAGFDGIVDELAVWTRHITVAEVASLYNSGSGKQLEHHGFPIFGAHATLNSSTALISPYTDGPDDGKTASFDGTTLNGIVLTAPTNTTSQITVTPDNGATLYGYIHNITTDSLSVGDQHTLLLDIV